MTDRRTNIEVELADGRWVSAEDAAREMAFIDYATRSGERVCIEGPLHEAAMLRYGKPCPRCGACV